MLAKIVIGFWLTVVMGLALILPIVPKPEAWYQMPLLPMLGDRARIMFFHVPAAWLSALAFIVSTAFGIRYLMKRDADDDVRSHSAAGIGLLFCILATVTGAIWAKFNWGTFWNWDPRQTSIFVLLLVYGAYFALRSAIDVEEKKAALSAVYSILAAVAMVFLMFIMPRLVDGLHPGSQDSENGGPLVSSGGMNATMRVIFYASWAGFTALAAWMWNIHTRVHRLIRICSSAE